MRWLHVRRSDGIDAALEALNGINTGVAKLVVNVRSITHAPSSASRQIAAGFLDLSVRTVQLAVSGGDRGAHDAVDADCEAECR